jgi:8-oxo-dGTP diphosphatase
MGAIGVSVVFFCHDGEGNFVLHKRSQNCRDEQGRWDVGGGALEFGESFEGAVKREIKEEYGVKALDLKYLGVSNILRGTKGLKSHWVAIFFAVKVDPKKVKNGDPFKIDKIGWFRKDKLPRPMHSKYGYIFKLVKEAGIV